MTLLQSLTSLEVLRAAAVLLALALAEVPLEFAFKRYLADHGLLEWCWDALLAPLLRAAAVVVFVLLAYPALFGLRAALPLAELLSAVPLRAATLFNVVCAASLLLGVLPALRRSPALVLPIQGALATAWVFHWFVTELGATAVGVWPGMHGAGFVFGVAFVGFHAGELAGRALGAELDRRFSSEGLDGIVAGALATLLQLPTVVAYGWVLGRQLTI